MFFGKNLEVCDFAKFVGLYLIQTSPSICPSSNKKIQSTLMSRFRVITRLENL